MESIGDILAKTKAKMPAEGKGFQPPKNSKTASESLNEQAVECQVCQDRGWLRNDVTFDHPDFGQLVECECSVAGNAARREKILWLNCDLPNGSGHMDFFHFETRDKNLKEAFELSFQLAGREIEWLTLLGGVDRGKTHLLVAVVREWLLQGRSAKYIVVPDLLNELKATFNRGGGDATFEQKFRSYKDVGLLALDDLGMESNTPWAQEQLDTLIDHRYVNSMALMVTSNKGLGDFSERIASRLERYENGRVFVLDGAEYHACKKEK